MLLSGPVYKYMNVVSAVPPIMVRWNIILKSKFVNIWAFHITGKELKVNKNKLTAIHEYLLFCNHSPSFEEFSVLITKSNDFSHKVMESRLTVRDKCALNKADISMPLELF